MKFSKVKNNKLKILNYGFDIDKEKIFSWKLNLEKVT